MMYMCCVECNVTFWLARPRVNNHSTMDV